MDMKGEERRTKLLEILKAEGGPVKGSKISSRLMVSRQIIVQDIALLRAEGSKIIATPQGYMLTGGEKSTIIRVIAVKHGRDEIRDELETIVALGGRVLDVTIEHKIYGEITGNIMTKSLYDVDQFVKKLENEKAKPLSDLTSGIHIHTVEADSQQAINRIEDALRDKGYLISKEV
jgi:transcriptional regulator of NAD metabolism